MFQGKIKIGKGLCLYTLTGINQQQGALTGGQGPRDLIGKVHMPGGINQIEIIGLTVFGCIWKTDGLAFNGDAAFAFNVHRVQNLISKIPLRNYIGGLNKAVRQRGFAVVNMGNDTEVSDILHVDDLIFQTDEQTSIFEPSAPFCGG